MRNVRITVQFFKRRGLSANFFVLWSRYVY